MVQIKKKKGNYRMRIRLREQIVDGKVPEFRYCGKQLLCLGPKDEGEKTAHLGLSESCYGSQQGHEPERHSYSPS